MTRAVSASNDTEASPTFCYCNLDLDPMTFIVAKDLSTDQKNELSTSRISKVILLLTTDIQTDSTEIAITPAASMQGID